MQRRSALKNLAMTLGSLASLPAWASGWTPDSLGTVSTLSISEEALLGDIVETFIPTTTTPGAKSLNVHLFVMRMVKDCYGEPAQATLQKGIALLEETAQQTYSKPFSEGDAAQRMDLLAKLSALTDPAGQAFVSMVKKLTIQGYMNSEYYLVNVEKFNMAPGFYHGCVPVPKLAVNGTN
ncbi:gluconate 2-dehydrogenase subunit 3 family protein [Spirosoma sp. RP8]|uniref:Gluconate 2-dehydrogenase subunit 3 family protein n=1 Tax=Spirosoma liriopis TaxID=2937440 RepID=A0ABT0HEY6_9BACT|nr:gluconate 2-dehydrogenase subunit 3 family protein [Spirosoma liriopis]MCK8490555.1 gluconate 2-dehydrogenase subunit 3 family protein [Spirosoma liriopis]